MPSSKISTESLFLRSTRCATLGGGVGVIVEMPGAGTTIPSGRAGTAVGSVTGSPTPGSVPSGAGGRVDRRAAGVDGSVSSSFVLNRQPSRVSEPFYRRLDSKTNELQAVLAHAPSTTRNACV